MLEVGRGNISFWSNHPSKLTRPPAFYESVVIHTILYLLSNTCVCTCVCVCVRVCVCTCVCVRVCVFHNILIIAYHRLISCLKTKHSLIHRWVSNTHAYTRMTCTHAHKCTHAHIQYTHTHTHTRTRTHTHTHTLMAACSLICSVFSCTVKM